jgi:hypothetical protein
MKLCITLHYPLSLSRALDLFSQETTLSDFTAKTLMKRVYGKGRTFEFGETSVQVIKKVCDLLVSGFESPLSIDFDHVLIAELIHSPCVFKYRVPWGVIEVFVGEDLTCNKNSTFNDQ